MAIEIGALRALLSLDSAAFEKGAKRAQASMSNLQRSLHRTGQNMQRIGTQMTTRMTLPIVAATGLLLRSSMKAIDAQSKMAQSLGTSTASMQVLARAADRAGISTGELEQVGRQLTKRLSQAATGAGPAVDALEQLGLKASDLAQMDLDQKIAVINRAIQDIVPEAEQAAVAMALFGDRAGIMAGRLDADTIATAADELERFGVTVTEIEADKIEEANDAMSALGLVGAGLGNQLAVALAPVLQSIAEKLADVGAWFANLSPQMRTMIGVATALAAAMGPVLIALGIMASGMAAAMGAAAGLTRALFTLRGALLTTGIGVAVVAAGVLIDQFFKLIERTGSFGNALEALKNVAVEVWERIRLGGGAMVAYLNGQWQMMNYQFTMAVSNMAGVFSDFLVGASSAARSIPGMDIMADQLGEAAASAGESAGAISRVAAEYYGAGEAALGAAADMSAAATAPLKSIGALTAIVEKTGEAGDAATGAAESFAAMNDAVEGLGEGAGGSGGGAGGGGGAGRAAETALSGIGDAVASVTSRMDDLREGTKTVFKDVLFEAKSFSEALSGVLNSLASKLFDTGFDSLFGIISGAMGFGGGSPAMQVALPNIMSGLPGYEGGGFTGFGARAGGMDGRGGFPAMLHPNETVIDHTKGGGGQNVHVTVSVDNNGNLRAFVDQRAQMAGQRAKNETLQAMPGAMREHDMRLG